LIGSDGGLLDAPRTVRELFLSPAERVDVLLDLRHAKPGEAITLTSLAFDAMEHETGAPAASARPEEKKRRPTPHQRARGTRRTPDARPSRRRASR
jgi:FtsP/CotA-like multicopper oxidase with cupredoxin domain